MFDPAVRLVLLATLAGACASSDASAPARSGAPADAAPIERARDAEADLVAFADRYADRPDYASDALLRAAVLARDAGHPDRERAHLERILRDYPDTDAGAWARYLRALSMSEAGDVAGARGELWSLVCPGERIDDRWEPSRCGGPFAPPRVVFGAWFELGQLAFDDGELERAEAAYAAALDHSEEGEGRVLLLYKLGWTLFRADRYLDAIRRFAECASTEIEQVHTEAIQYIAISISERDWNGDGRDDPAFGLDRPEVRSWLASSPLAAEVLRALVATYVDLADCHAARRTRDELLSRSASEPVSLGHCTN